MNCPQELPPAPAGKHYHLCADGCGDYRVCSQPDECDTAQWICPPCEQQRLDHYVTLMATKDSEQSAPRSA